MDHPTGFETERTQTAQQAARVILGVGLLLLGLYVLEGFLRALVWAAVLAIATWPLYQRTRRRFVGPDPAPGQEGHAILLPALFTTAVFLLFVVPLGLVAVQLGHEARVVAGTLADIRLNGIAPPEWLHRLPAGSAQALGWWDANLRDPADAQALLGRVDRAQIMLVSREFGARLLHNAVLFGFTLATLFFLFRDGDRVVRQMQIASRSMFGARGEDVARQIVASIHGTVDGMVLVGMGVGTILGAGYWLTGVPHPVLLGALTAVAAVIPLGAPVVLGAAVLLVLSAGSTVAAVALLAVGLVVIFVADHAVRPALIGGATKLPFLWVLLGLLGGIETFGLLGLFVGPAIMAALILLWREWTSRAAHATVITPDRTP